jgi:hypothetical protein
MQATYQDMTTLITLDMAPIIIDTGASISISPYASDFEGPLRPVQSITKRDRIWPLNNTYVEPENSTIYKRLSERI